MTIRKATPRDIDRILQIYADARTFMQESGNPDQWGTNYPPEEMIREDVATGYSYVCVEGDEILGVFYYAEGTDPTYEYIENGAWLNDAPYGVIHRIAVGVRGRGVAAACFDFGLSQCHNLKIDTHEDNLPMQKSLEKNGFVRCGTIYVADGSARIAYQKNEGGSFEKICEL